MNVRFDAAVLAAALSLSLSETAYAQLRELTTDRPDQTESPISVDKGHYQLEMDFFNMTRDRERDGGLDLRTTESAISAFNFKYGLTDNTDIQFVLDTYLRSKTKNMRTGAVLDKIDGVGDLTIRYKYNFFGNDGGNAFALMPFVKLPTNSNGLENKKVEGGVIIPYAIDAGNVGIGANVGLNKAAPDFNPFVGLSVKF